MVTGTIWTCRHCSLTRLRIGCIMTAKRGALRQAVSLDSNCINYLSLNNRHWAEWRLLLFTMIVTVKRPICKVIRMLVTSFREMMANRLCCSSASLYSYEHFYSGS